ncbi:reprolysin-like metallopeptidase [Chryseobacterium gallinarum]|uniref:T9SS type A sorting domain-containing protein n=1 Tax=Chryseobacterium gallinarum TaxID=1324352 RepID=A0ABX6KMM8_CHRGL|nr:M12 family metallo-peptidase [Chryseobacterium gallinarum]QIY89897.1 T9SS type A sorting domain-containing protein [Chryseobacterium gallinarum]
MKLRITLISICASFLMNAQVLNTNGLGSDDLPGTTFKLNIDAFKRSIDANRKSLKKISGQSIVLTLIDGTQKEFILSENNLVSKRLDNIITFDGYSKDRQDKIKLTLVGDEISAMVKSSQGYYIIEPYKTKKGEYRIYNSFEMFGEKFQCGTDENEFKESLDAIAKGLNVQRSVSGFPYGSSLKTFRMAVATTGEFTTALGNQDAALGELVAMLNLINQIYESELSISFNLIDKTTNKTLIFTDGTTDPFTIDPSFASAANSQTGFNTMDSNGTLPYADYDIGHTFHIMPGTNGSAQGQAGPRPCTSTLKARAWSQWTLSMPKSLAANLIVHEMGHQFGAGHTYNAVGGTPSSPTFCTSGWNSAAAVEPGSGSTIMAYKNNCTTPNDQTNTGNNGLNYFHAKSIDQVLNTLAVSSTCFTSVAVNNTPPSANAGNTAISIPKNTPFRLKGIGSDAEDTNLSYTWDQVDVATANDKGAFGSTINGAGGYSAVNSTTAPLFRSEQSITTTERYFPKMKFVLNNQNTPPTNEAEALPLVARTMKMRFTVRDNSVISGGADSDQVVVTVTNQGPLTVTYPNSNVSVNADSNINVTWDVNQTDALKSTVNILLSTDGGETFPYTLAANVPNNGTATVAIPFVPYTDKARIKVTAVINDYAEFFDVSNTNFTINSSCNAFQTIIAENPKSVTAIQGSPQANLNLQPQTSSNDTYSSKTLTFDAANMSPQNWYIYNQTQTAPHLLVSSSSMLSFRFKVTETGAYTLSYPSPNGVSVTIYKGTQTGTANFVTSNAVYSGTGTSFTYYRSFTANLEKGVDYFVTTRNLSNTPAGSSVVLSISGPGNFYNIVNNPVGVNYTYIAINTTTNAIIGTSATADFTTLPPGTYTVQGISFTGAESALLNKTINELNQNKVCYQLSRNTVNLTITSSLATKEVAKKTIGLVPNPVKDYLQVHSDEKITHYEIYDASGRLMENNTMNNSEINFSRFKTGVYMLKLLNGKTLVHQSKIIKK